MQQVLRTLVHCFRVRADQQSLAIQRWPRWVASSIMADQFLSLLEHALETSSIEFLKKLLSTPGPSGFEAAAARVWREEAQQFADAVDVDVSGNSIAELKGSGGPRVMLAGHIDEIGVMI